MLPDNLRDRGVALAVEAFDAGAVQGGKFDRGEVTLEIAPARIASSCGYLKYDQRFVRLSSVTAVDRHPAEPRFEVVYHLYSTSQAKRLRLKVQLGEGGAGEGGAEDPDGFLVAAEVAEDDAEVALGLDVAGDEAEEFLEVAGGVVEAAEDAEDDALVEEDFSELGFLGAKLLVEGEGFLVAFLFLEDDAEGEVKGGLIAEGEGLADVFFGEGGLAVLEVDAGEEVESVGLVGVGGEDLAEDGLGLGELVGLLVLKGKLDGLVDG